MTAITEIWKKLLNGDKKALEELYQYFVQDLYNFGKRFNPDDTLVEDCIQNLFIDIWERRNRLKNTPHVKAYLFLALKRRLYAESQKRSKIIPLPAREQVDYVFQLDFEIQDPDSAPKSEQIIKLKKALEQLSVRQKQILFLRFDQGMDYPEISTAMGISYQSARNALHRALEKLRECMIFIVLLSTRGLVFCFT